MSETVTRAEYEALLERVRALEVEIHVMKGGATGGGSGGGLKPGQDIGPNSQAMWGSGGGASFGPVITPPPGVTSVSIGFSAGGGSGGRQSKARGDFADGFESVKLSPPSTTKGE